MKLNDSFFKTVIPACVEARDSNQKVIGLLRSQGIEKSFTSYLRSLDEAEFRLFLARVVIKASGMGVVGAELSEKVAFLGELRSGK